MQQEVQSHIISSCLKDKGDQTLVPTQTSTSTSTRTQYTHMQCAYRCPLTSVL